MKFLVTKEASLIIFRIDSMNCEYFIHTTRLTKALYFHYKVYFNLFNYWLLNYLPSRLVDNWTKAGNPSSDTSGFPLGDFSENLRPNFFQSTSGLVQRELGRKEVVHPVKGWQVNNDAECWMFDSISRYFYNILKSSTLPQLIFCCCIVESLILL